MKKYFFIAARKELYLLTFRALALRQSDFLIYAELYILQLSPLLPQRMFKRTRNEGKVSSEIYRFMT